MRRERTYSDPRVIEVIRRHFVPAAVNINTLQRQDDEEGRFFRTISWQGRFRLDYAAALRRAPEGDHGECHQGQYVATVDGELLGSRHTADPDELLAMLEGALSRWPERQAQREASSVGDFAPDGRFAWRYPDDGLVLNTGCTDLAPPGGLSDEWGFDAHNQDYAWFSGEEMLSLVPEGIAEGDAFDVPRAVARRLVRYHLLDIVRGETSPWPKELGDALAMRLGVTAATDDTVRMTLRGEGRLEERGSWCAQPPRGAPYRRGEMCCMITERGFEPSLLGFLEFDRKAGRFVRFDVVAAGTRWGGTTFNNRQQDVEPAPMGIAMTIAGNDARDRTPPHGGRPEAYFDA